MRIGLVCPYSFSTPGGVQAHVWGLGEYLVGRGHDVDVLAPGLPAVALPRRPHPAFTSAGRAFPVPWNGSVARVAWDRRTDGVARGWLAAGRFDVVHLHEPLTPSIAWQVLHRARVPALATVHTARRDQRLHRRLGHLFRGRLDRLGDVVAVSDVAADLAEAYLPMRPRVVPNAIWTADFAGEATSGPWRGGARPRVTFLGRDEPRKGLDVLLAALPLLLAGHDVEVVVAGPGGRELPPGCRPVEARDDDARARLLATTDVLVAPATFGESFGIVLVEALAAGCQVVASDLPAFRAVLGDAGATFAVGDAAGLAEAVLRQLAAPVPPAELARQASQYDWSAVGPRLEAALLRLAGRPIA